MVFAESVFDHARPRLAGSELLFGCVAFVGTLVVIPAQSNGDLHRGIAHYAERGEDFPVCSWGFARVFEDKEILLSGLGFCVSPAVRVCWGEARRNLKIGKYGILSGCSF